MGVFEITNLFQIIVMVVVIAGLLYAFLDSVKGVAVFILTCLGVHFLCKTYLGMNLIEGVIYSLSYLYQEITNF